MQIELLAAIGLGCPVSTSSEHDLIHSSRGLHLNQVFNPEYHASAWVAHSLDSNHNVLVRRVDIQGRHGYDQWVEQFALEYTTDGKEWKKVIDPLTNQAKKFEGNGDSDSIVENVLMPPIITKAVKIIPLKWNTSVSMRCEVYFENIQQ